MVAWKDFSCVGKQRAYIIYKVCCQWYLFAIFFVIGLHSSLQFVSTCSKFFEKHPQNFGVGIQTPRGRIESGLINENCIFYDTCVCHLYW